MSWLALFDADANCLSACSTAIGALKRGTFVLESRVSPQAKPQILFDARFPGQERSQLTVQAMPGGGIHLLYQRGAAILHKALAHDAEDQADVLRMSYAWDMARNAGRLVLERPGTQKIFQQNFTEPLPLTGQEIVYFKERSKQMTLHSDVCYMAISDAVEPIGPMPAICPRTPVQTPYGFAEIGRLQRGDLVRTLTGESVPVLQVVRRTVPACGAFTPIRLRAPFFGLKQDIVLAQEARLLVGGSQVEYLFGSDNVLVPVKHLTTGSSARIEAGHPLVTYVQLLLPDHQGLVLAGTAVESLNIGRIRRKPEVINSTMLASFPPHTIPEHSKTVCPILKHFEAVTLAEHRAA